MKLTWDDLEEWAGNKIVTRGRNYQKQGRVSDLVKTEDNCLIAWVDGTELYATKVTMEDDGLPDSICTCPYEFDCKHGVATVLEYLERAKNNKRVPIIGKKDKRIKLLELEDEDFKVELEDGVEPVLPADLKGDIDRFLKSMTKDKLIELVHKLAKEYPKIARELIDSKQLLSGDIKPMIKRLRDDIREIGEGPAWQDYWDDEDYTPDYSEIRAKLEALLEAGYADEVMSLGKELMSSGTSLVAIIHDHGETAIELEECIPVIVKALKKSSMKPADKLSFAVDAVINDQYSLFESLYEFINRKHSKKDWNTLAEWLIKQLDSYQSGDFDDSRNYKRDRISDWLIYAFEKSGRDDDIIPLCEKEAVKTGSYHRLVKRLIQYKRYKDAEQWIHKSIGAIGDKWPGITSQLRGELLNIRTRQRDWPEVAAMRVDEFVRYPSTRAYAECKKTSIKVKKWAKVRKYLLEYLGSGLLPWKQKGWSLPEPDLGASGAKRDGRFPRIGNLIDIAIFEKNPEQILFWYDKIPKNRYWGFGVNIDDIATAIQSYAPERAVDMWKRKAENLIAQVKPKAYKEAAKYLKKAAKVMEERDNHNEWNNYILGLRKKHIRKIRLIEVLDNLDNRPIVKIKG
jgi:uncharacterized Zn finger protein